MNAQTPTNGSGAGQPAENRMPIPFGASVKAVVPTDMDQTWRLARIITESGMAPQSLKTPQQVMVAIMHGMEVGLTPMAALQSIAVINGNPALWGDGMLALVRGSGILEDLEERIEGDGDNRVAICIAKRKGQKSPIERRFSMQNAKEAGLSNKPGPWKQYPQRMLQMRARSWCLRDGFADVLKGLSGAEEMRDVGGGMLEAQPDGSYAVQEVRPSPPPRPTRTEASGALPVPAGKPAQAEPQQEEPLPVHVFIDWEGEAHEFHDAELFVNALCIRAEEAPTRDAYRALFEDNREAIQAIGSGDLMVQINETRQAVEMNFAAAEAGQQETDGNDAPDPEAALKGLVKSAQDYADRGTDEFRRFWNTLGKTQRDELRPYLAGFQKAAARADAEAGDDDPFPAEPEPEPGDIQGQLVP